jgi:hypothetical protein
MKSGKYPARSDRQKFYFNHASKLQILNICESNVSIGSGAYFQQYYYGYNFVALMNLI